MNGVVYEIEISLPARATVNTEVWLDPFLREILEIEGFESGRAYREQQDADDPAEGHLAFQFRVRSEAELTAFLATGEATQLARLQDHVGPQARIIARTLFPASELATPSDASGGQTVTECPNCSARVEGKFCAACGQDNNVSVVAFHRLLGEFIRDFFNFDSRLFNSIWPLLAKPGFLTVEYLAGRRATYLPPVRMTLFLSIIFFGLVAWQASDAMAIRVIDAQELSTNVPEDQKLFSLELEEDDRIEMTAATSGWLKSVEDRTNANLHRLGNDAGYQREILQKAIGNLPVMMFILLPVFALMLKLLHLRSGRYYVEHLIYSMHVHAFNFLTLAVLNGGSMLIDARGLGVSVPWFLSAAWWVWFALYPWIAMKRVYRQGFFKTTLKFGVSSVGYVVLLVLGTVSTAVVSLSM